MDEPRAQGGDPVAVSLAGLDRRITETYAQATDKIEALNHYFESRLDASEKALSSAEQTTSTVLTATKVSTDQAVEVAKDALDTRLRAGDEQLLIHIEAQKESVRTALEALAVRLSDKDKTVDVLMKARDVAQEKFEAQVRQNEAKANDFRLSLSDLGKEMSTRRETEAATKALSERIDQNTTMLGELRSRLDVGPAQLGTIQSRLDQSSGMSSGREAAQLALARGIAMAGGLIGIAAVIVGLLFRK